MDAAPRSPIAHSFRIRLAAAAVVVVSMAVLAACANSARFVVDGAQANDGFVPIGGIEQWMAIRGDDRSRPPILFLHGGPCDAQSPHLSLFGPWEEQYIVAQWDQRGAGETFQKNGTSTPDMTFERLVQDAVEVAEYVTGQLGVPKLILIGHSWGAILALDVVRRRPDLFHALVNTGQPVIGSDIIERMRSSAIVRAQAAGNAAAATELRNIDPFQLVSDMTKFVGLLVEWTEPFIPSDQVYIAAPTAFPNDFCASKLNPYLLTIDARSGGYELPIPFFVIQGRDDNRTPPDAARAYLEQVRAPKKGYTAVDGGHFAFVTNATGFLEALDNDMRSLETK
jgi:pimeloyl-ACP methyl ester carboxylesterase